MGTCRYSPFGVLPGEARIEKGEGGAKSVEREYLALEMAAMQ